MEKETLFVIIIGVIFVLAIVSYISKVIKRRSK